MSEITKPKQHWWRPWGDHPIVILVVLFSGLIAILIGIASLYNLLFDKQTPQLDASKKETNVNQRPNKKTKILFEGENFYINGIQLKLPDDLGAFENAIGQQSSSHKFDPDVFVWNDIGLYCRASPKNNEVNYLFVQLCDPEIGEQTLESPHYLNKRFSGFLILDNVVFDGQIPIEWLNKHKLGKKFVQNSQQPISWDLKYGKKRLSFLSGAHCALVYTIDYFNESAQSLD